MNIQNKLLNISGTAWGAGSEQTASCVVLIAQSGTVFIPVQCTDEGCLMTSSGC